MDDLRNWDCIFYLSILLTFRQDLSDYCMPSIRLCELSEALLVLTKVADNSIQAFYSTYSGLNQRKIDMVEAYFLSVKIMGKGSGAYRYSCLVLFVLILFIIFTANTYEIIGSVLDRIEWGNSQYSFNDSFPFREKWIDLYGLVQSLCGKKQIENFTIYKTSYGKMVSVREELSDDECESRFIEIYSIMEYLENKDIPYYYITSILPIQDAEDIPKGAMEGSHYNQNRLRKQLDENDVKLIDLQNLDEIKSINKEELFYFTDHHWTLNTCFAAYQGIVDKIEKDMELGVSADEIKNLGNYNHLCLEKSFLGSYGIKVGEFYAGKDNFEILVPKFDTDLTFRSYDANSNLIMEKRGKFYEALIDDEIVEDPDYKNKYNAFCNMGYIENHVVNNLAPNNLKCLYISHSYGRPLTMYLSLIFNQVVNLDPQEGRFNGNYLSYIDEYNPDVVIIQAEFEGMIIGNYKTSD